jgi:hypothetical protein
MPDPIDQPRDRTYKDQYTEARLVWSRTFARDNNERFENVQKFVDSEIIRYMVPYTPMRNGLLSKSAVLGTKIGSGRIIYASPYARFQYYGYVMVSRVTGSPYARQGESKVKTNRMLHYNLKRHPKAQRLWFEVMKQDKKEALLRGAQRIANRGK